MRKSTQRKSRIEWLPGSPVIEAGDNATCASPPVSSLTCEEDNFTIARLGVRSLWLPDVTCLPNGWVGSAVVSANTNIVVLGRPHGSNDLQRGIRRRQSFYLPMMYRNDAGGTYNFAIYLQNTDTVNASSVDFLFFDEAGSVHCAKTVSLPTGPRLDTG